jgi:hypothetical protein
MLNDFQTKSVALNKNIRSFKQVTNVKNWNRTAKSTFKTVSYVSGLKSSSKVSLTNFFSKISVDQNSGKVEVEIQFSDTTI